jgi:uncharacterized protein
MRARVLVVVTAALAAFALHAADVPPALPAPVVPGLTAHVMDQAHVLAPQDAQHLDDTLSAYERKTGHQLAVWIVPSLGGQSIEELSLHAAEQWRLGDQKRSDGLLVVVAVQDHAMRIEVGYGLEGAIPDVIASRVIREQLTPHFQNNDFAGGLNAGFDVLMRAASGENLGAPVDAQPLNTRNWFSIFAVAVLLMIGMPRWVRAPLLLVVGGVLGWLVLGSLVWAGALGVLGLVLGVVLPRGRGFLPWMLAGSFMGRGGRGGGFGGGGGGFSGGGGGFGGGGASGKW